jgi:hypothetical protein
MMNTKLKERNEVVIADLRLANSVRPLPPRPSRYYLLSLQEDRNDKELFKRLRYWIIRLMKVCHKP